MKNRDKEEILQNKYISSFPILIVLFIVNIAVYIMVTPLAIYGFFLIGLLEYKVAKRRSFYFKRSFLLSLLIPIFLLIPGFIALIFNNNIIGLPVGTIGLLIVLSTRIYLMTVKVRKNEESKLRLPKLLSVEVAILLILNIYLINFYNYANHIRWMAKIPSGITSTLKIEEKEIVFLTNDDFLIEKFYNFPQTYILNKKNGNILEVKNSYKFSEEFKPFQGSVQDLEINNLTIKISKERLIVRNKETGETILNFIAKGKIVTTPILEGKILYFATNGKTFLDKVKRTNIYAIEIND